jgi:hypothetical protein
MAEGYHGRVNSVIKAGGGQAFELGGAPFLGFVFQGVRPLALFVTGLRFLYRRAAELFSKTNPKR